MSLPKVVSNWSRGTEVAIDLKCGESTRSSRAGEPSHAESKAEKAAQEDGQRLAVTQVLQVETGVV